LKTFPIWISESRSLLLFILHLPLRLAYWFVHPPATPNIMAFISANKEATVAAIFMVVVVVVVSSMGMLAAAETPACRERHCISECPSKCEAKGESSCEYLKHGSPGCSSSYYCMLDCTSSCQSACEAANSTCPAGGIQGCTPVCSSKCDEYCYNLVGPGYVPCLGQVIQGCMVDCEKDCKSGKLV
jgi:hypothetical protein